LSDELGPPPEQPAAPAPPPPPVTGYQREWLVALLLSILMGPMGADRFYLGYIGMGVLKILSWFTCVGGVIWWVVDVFLIASDQLRDIEGRPLAR
jgi:TM2 domain-containing membrane protein YozV